MYRPTACRLQCLFPCVGISMSLGDACENRHDDKSKY